MSYQYYHYQYEQGNGMPLFLPPIQQEQQQYPIPPPSVAYYSYTPPYSQLPPPCVSVKEFYPLPCNATPIHQVTQFSYSTNNDHHNIQQQYQEPVPGHNHLSRKQRKMLKKGIAPNFNQVPLVKKSVSPKRPKEVQLPKETIQPLSKRPKPIVTSSSNLTVENIDVNSPTAAHLENQEMSSALTPVIKSDFAPDSVLEISQKPFEWKMSKKSKRNYTPEQWKIYEDNLHLSQVFFNRFKFVQKESKFSYEQDLCITPTLSKVEEEAVEKYHRNQHPIHNMSIETKWIARSCLMNCTSFLTDHYNPEKHTHVVVYAYECKTELYFIDVLAEMFPNLSFMVYCPKKSHIISMKHPDNAPESLNALGRNQRIALRLRQFSPSTVEDMHLHGDPENRILISIVRNLPKHLQLQEKLYRKVKPDVALLSFAPTGRKGTTKYLNGNLQYPVWSSTPITCAWLLITEKNAVEDPTRKDFDNKVLTKKFSIFNCFTRTTHYEHEHDTKHFCHCFDCSAEINILDRYVKKTKSVVCKLQVQEESCKITKLLAVYEKLALQYRRLRDGKNIDTKITLKLDDKNNFEENVDLNEPADFNAFFACCESEIFNVTGTRVNFDMGKKEEENANDNGEEDDEENVLLPTVVPKELNEDVDLNASDEWQ